MPADGTHLAVNVARRSELARSIRDRPDGSRRVLDALEAPRLLQPAGKKVSQGSLELGPRSFVHDPPGDDGVGGWRRLATRWIDVDAAEEFGLALIEDCIVDVSWAAISRS